MKNQGQQEPRQAAVQTASSEDQDYIYTPVPQNKRYGWIKMFFVWLCWNVVVGDLATGTALGSSLNFRDALIALSIGDLVLIVMMILNASPRFAALKGKLNYKALADAIRAKSASSKANKGGQTHE